MIGWIIAALIAALVFALLGFTGIAKGFASIAKILFYIFLVVLAIIIIMNIVNWYFWWHRWNPSIFRFSSKNWRVLIKMENIWFDNWESIIRTMCLTTLAYIAMVILLRASGKRTLSKMNAFDFIITIALGSSLASVALNKSIALADGILAIMLFVGFQFLLTWLSVRIKTIKGLITSSPSLIFYKGTFLSQTMKKERLTVEEIYSAARQKGISSLDEIDMIILETTGEITVIEQVTSQNTPTYTDVKMKP